MRPLQGWPANLPYSAASRPAGSGVRARRVLASEGTFMPADVLQNTAEPPSAGAVEILEPISRQVPNPLAEGGTPSAFVGGLGMQSPRRRVPLGANMRVTIAVKIFGIAVALLVLMGAAALL